jgi:ankyrin repeat protein
MNQEALQAVIDAVRAGDSERTRALLSAHPELVTARDATGVSLILLALYNRQAELARTLAGLRSLDAFEASALGDAARLEELLREDAAAARFFSPDGFTALHLAAFFGHAGTASLLLDAGADPAAVSKNAMQVEPLHAAAARGSIEVAGLLLARGADPNARQQGGWTPLQSRALHADLPFVELLLRHGADPGQRADDGRSALDMARESGGEAVQRALEKATRA